uniref:DUF1801 domain-containing protein n=1 Tax=Flavobacterium sp. TaxID=239 RepID=UPI004049CF24
MKPAEAFILAQESPYKDILLEIQAIIKQEVKESELKFKWKLPFFYLNQKPLCYLLVNTKKKYVDVSFFHGHLISVHQDVLVKENRTQVQSIRYQITDSIDYEILQDILQEAVQIHHQKYPTN